MGEKHTVKFEPVGVEIEVDEDETILEGAFRNGLMIFHGCKEGQCAACKNFLLDGDVDHEAYSTFALADYEADEGFTLLCRAYAFSDCTVELLHYDEEMLRSGVPIQTVQTEVESVEHLTHDMRLLTLRLVDPPEVVFNAGQYMDLEVPGEDDITRAYSMANTPATDAVLQFIIKVYPGGRFSSKLDDGTIAPGLPMKAVGPYGTFVMRDRPDRDLIFVAGGAGMSAVWALLNSLVNQGVQRKTTFYYGARTEADLFYVDEIMRLGEKLPAEFHFIPALSDDEEGTWEGEHGFIHEVVERLEGDLSNADAYLCGPPPMIDAAVPVLEMKGVPEDHIHYDKFTISAAPDEEVD